MSSRVVRVIGARIDGVGLAMREATIQTGHEAGGRGRWELTGYAGPLDASLRVRLLVDAPAAVVVDTSAGRIAGSAIVSLMAFADASGTRTFVRIQSTSPPSPRRHH